MISKRTFFSYTILSIAYTIVITQTTEKKCIVINKVLINKMEHYNLIMIVARLPRDDFLKGLPPSWVIIDGRSQLTCLDNFKSLQGSNSSLGHWLARRPSPSASLPENEVAERKTRRKELLPRAVSSSRKRSLYVSHTKKEHPFPFYLTYYVVREAITAGRSAGRLSDSYDWYKFHQFTLWVARSDTQSCWNVICDVHKE